MEKYRLRHGLNISEMESFCDKAPQGGQTQSIYTLLEEAHSYLKDHYSCEMITANSRCSKY